MEWRASAIAAFGCMVMVAGFFLLVSGFGFH
jgi:hypothetical protein